MPYEKDISEREKQYGIHANEVETSLMIEATPRLVAADLSVCEWIGSLDDPKTLKPEFAPATYAWKSSDISRSGVMGDATAASADKGRLWMDRAARSLAVELCRLTGYEQKPV
jgi:creatinine amidohydrolase